MPMTTDKAQVTLPSDREVKVTRSFRAARALVYRAYTEPELVRRWLLGFYFSASGDAPSPSADARTR